LETVKIIPRPELWEVFFTWLVMGIQSFGGGSATFFLVHQACINRGWMEEDEFVQAWALAQVSPGINLIKLTVLIGKRLRGWPGLVAAMTGLLVPSALVTVLMTAGFSLIQSQPLVQAAMRGIAPAAIGLTLAMAIQMGMPVLTRARQEGQSRLSSHLLVLAGSTFLMAARIASPVIVLLLAGLSTLALLAIFPAKEPSSPPVMPE
jgi:chromate transporter